MSSISAVGASAIELTMFNSQRGHQVTRSSPLRRYPGVSVAIWILAVMCLAGTACTRERTAAGSLDVQFSPSKQQYRSGEEVVISVSLRNSATKACRLSGVPEGSVSVLSLTRDGASVQPATTNGTYIDGVAGFLTSNLVLVEPGAAISMSLRSERWLATRDRLALATSAPTESDEASVALWPVDQPGRYVLTATYLVPTLAGAATDRCLTSGTAVSTSFTVISE